MSTAIPIVSAVLLVTATGLAFLASLGLHRFDDVFSRVHAATKASTLGVLLVAFGAALQMEQTGDVVKLLLAGLLQLISAPVSAHMISRAAYWSGDELSRGTVIDELAESDLRR
jgi:multicomponent Na+:H+ antiporter subunit G